ncbi:MAG TPA: TldD/PmbA family protein [Candidatus Eisenbacteria bacterium]|nr:TldD/PmbA family protein [Candidatus Eisenbacteria bacterium]
MTASAQAPAHDLPLVSPELVTELLELARAQGGEFAEVYAERGVHSGLALEENRLRHAQYSVHQGVGVRVIAGEQTGYAYADGFDPGDLREAARVAARIARGASAGARPPAFRVVDAPPPFVLHEPAPLTLETEAKADMLQRANAAARGHDARVHEVSASMADSSRRFLVANSDGVWAEDTMFLARLTVSVVAADGQVRQHGLATGGGSVEARYFTAERPPESIALDAATSAVTLLAAREPDAGSWPVVVAPGWGGVMVHECFGHSMEGDGIRKHSSIRATQRGQLVAAPCVTIVDSGRVPFSRGSFRVDDEGTPAQRTVLVQDGILVGYMWDVLNARLANERPTGNGRRASYREFPLCRMTNTWIEPGPHAPGELIASVDRGLYCKHLAGGSVNPADGNFSFQVTEAWRIERGRLTEPVRNATLTGNGNDAMLKIDAVANDLVIDGTTGSCGKDGQWKPVGVGQPTVRFTGITVGGTRT